PEPRRRPRASQPVIAARLRAPDGTPHDVRPRAASVLSQKFADKFDGVPLGQSHARARARNRNRPFEYDYEHHFAEHEHETTFEIFNELTTQDTSGTACR